MYLFFTCVFINLNTNITDEITIRDIENGFRKRNKLKLKVAVQWGNNTK